MQGQWEECAGRVPLGDTTSGGAAMLQWFGFQLDVFPHIH